MEPEDADAQVTGWSEWLFLPRPDELPPYDAERSADLMKEILAFVTRQITCASCTPDHPDWDGLTACIDGRIYGPCDYEDEEFGYTCSGFCISDGECQCVCHAEPSKAR